MKRVTYIILCGLICFSVLLFAGILLSQEKFTKVDPIDEKYTYRIHDMQLAPREKIASYIVEEGKIYVFFDCAGLVNVYSTDGTFEYGIQVSSSANGTGDIAFFEGQLYIMSRRSVIYTFEGRTSLNFVDTTDREFVNLRKVFNQEKSHVFEDEHYVLSELSNEILIQETSRPVISFPARSLLAEHLIIFGVLFLACSMIYLGRVGGLREPG